MKTTNWQVRRAPALPKNCQEREAPDLRWKEAVKSRVGKRIVNLFEWDCDRI